VIGLGAQPLFGGARLLNMTERLREGIGIPQGDRHCYTKARAEPWSNAGNGSARLST
jgi:hypothetical protein